MGQEGTPTAAQFPAPYSTLPGLSVAPSSYPFYGAPLTSYSIPSTYGAYGGAYGAYPTIAASGAYPTIAASGAVTNAAPITSPTYSTLPSSLAGYGGYGGYGSYGGIGGYGGIGSYGGLGGYGAYGGGYGAYGGGYGGAYGGNYPGGYRYGGVHPGAYGAYPAPAGAVTSYPYSVSPVGYAGRATLPGPIAPGSYFGYAAPISTVALPQTLSTSISRMGVPAQPAGSSITRYGSTWVPNLMSGTVPYTVQPTAAPACYASGYCCAAKSGACSGGSCS